MTVCSRVIFFLLFEDIAVGHIILSVAAHMDDFFRARRLAVLIAGIFPVDRHHCCRLFRNLSAGAHSLKNVESGGRAGIRAGLQCLLATFEIVTLHDQRRRGEPVFLDGLRIGNDAGNITRVMHPSGRKTGFGECPLRFFLAARPSGMSERHRLQPENLYCLEALPKRVIGFGIREAVMGDVGVTVPELAEPLSNEQFGAFR